MRKSIKVATEGLATVLALSGIVAVTPTGQHIINNVKAQVTVKADQANNQKVVLNIADYGARANDPNFDNGPIINRLIDDLPKAGGTIVIPEGDFTIKTPIKVNHSFTTIQGTNDGWRSGVDASNSNGQSFGGSHLSLSGSGDAIQVISPDSHRITGCEFNNLGITNSGSKGIGIDVKSDNDHITIQNMAFKGLDTPIQVKGADAIHINGNIIAENRNGIKLTGASQQAIINNNSIGAQPGGSGIFLENANSFNITGNTIYPDGKQGILMYNPVHGTITGNTISSYGTGLITMLSSNGNDSNGNFGNCNEISGNQLTINKWNGGYGYDTKWGAIHISGYGNNISSNTIEMDSIPDNPTGILIMHGDNNIMNGNSIDPLHSDNAKVVVNGGANNNIVTASINNQEFQNGLNNSNKNVPLD